MQIYQTVITLHEAKLKIKYWEQESFTNTLFFICHCVFYMIYLYYRYYRKIGEDGLHKSTHQLQIG